MRTERQHIDADAGQRLPSVDRIGGGARPSTNGTHASMNGHGGHANGKRIEPSLRAAPDWDSFLPERAGSLSWRVQSVLKRFMDLAVAIPGLILLSPLFAVVAVAIRLSSPGPLLYVCEYVGYRGRRFTGYKFRTMVADAEQQKGRLNHLNHMKGPAFKIREDPRITALGRVLRKYSIDEFPQLWNVVKGDMTLVGPRPPLPEEWAEYEPWHRAKLVITPGITCYWQVNGRSEITDFDEWARLDLKYIEEWNLWTDVKILAQTVPAVLWGRGAY